MTERTNKALVTTTALAAAAGCIATWKLYSEWQKIRNAKERNLTDLAREINADDLAILARSENYALKNCAKQVLSDRMVSKKNLKYLLEQCTSENQTRQMKAVSVLCTICKTREFKPIVMKNNVLATLLKCVKMISNDFQVAKLAENCYADYEVEQTLKFSIVTILDLVSESDSNLTVFFKTCKELVAFLLELISDPSDNITTDIRRLSILILQQMMQHEQMRCNLISYGIIHRTTLCFLRTIGDAWISRNCLQILVMHINLFEDYVTEEFLQEMAQLGIIPVLVGCLKSDDPDLIYWSTALLHEFLLKDLHRGVISKIPNLVKTLYNILVSSESSLQRLVLRIYCFLSINDDNFKKKLLKFKPLLKRLSVCLASGNTDLLYWSMLLVHDLAMTGKQAALKMIQANEDLLKSTILLTQDTLEGPCDIKLVAETLGFFCSCEPLHKMAVEYGCIKTVLGLLKSESTELQFWASSLLLNLAMSSDEARERIIKDGGIGLLLEMAVKESEMPQITAQASKILVMLGFTDASLQLSLKAGIDSSIKIDGKEHSPVKHGINMVKINFLEYKISRGRAFDLGNLTDAASLLAELKNLKHNELFIMTTQGEVNSFMKEVQGMNILTALEEYGLFHDEFEENDCWCVVAQSDRCNSVKSILANQAKESLELTISINLSDQVNTFVQESLLKPILNILVSAPACSNISKVPELEILSTLARHQKHQTVMLSTAGLLDYIAELIWCFACMGTDQLAAKPLMVAHCVGAMKISHSLSTNPDSHNRFCDSPLLGAIKSFLFTSCGVLLVSLKEDAEYFERANLRRTLCSPDEDIFVSGRESQLVSESSNKNTRHSAVFSDIVDVMGETDSSHNVNLAVFQTRKPGQTERYSVGASDVFDEGSGIISPFCADPKTQGEEIEALIAQVTFEKTFRKIKEDDTADGDKQLIDACAIIKDETDQVQEDDVAVAASFPVREELNFEFQNEVNYEGMRRNPNRDSRLSERSRSSRRSESDFGRRADEHDNDNFDFDDFEEEDLPPIPDNDDDDLGLSQGRGFFDVTRMASAQRMRSSSAFNPNDWPTTRTGSLSRTLSEAAQRAKSPLKDIASDLEDFDEALVNLTNYALMTTYFAIHRGKHKQCENISDIFRFVHILWCILLGCKQENRIQWGMVVAATISKLCSASPSDGENEAIEYTHVVKLDVSNMTTSMLISNDYLEVYNGNWTFESITATKHVSKLVSAPGTLSGWYYEVSLFSKGIMQIGWTSDRTLHEPEKGLGVGDNPKSFAFDGSRCRVWHGQGPHDDSKENNYGKKWSIGDTVSCLLSVNGDASFWLNGQDLGTGLKNIDMSLDWYPAVSLSLDQQCKVNFGGEHFLYEPPLGYKSIEQAASTEMQALHSQTKQDDVFDESSQAHTSVVFTKSTDVADWQPNVPQSPPTLSRKAALQRHKSDLDFSPKDLLDSKGLVDACEVLYFEVKCSANKETTTFDIGYQSVARKKKFACKVKEKRLFIPNGDETTYEIIHFDEIVGCGLIWPIKKIFFTIDGIGTQFAINLADRKGTWEESLDEIIPYFSKEGLHVNFGQGLFWSQTMNSSFFRRNFFQIMHDAILRREEGT